MGGAVAVLALSEPMLTRHCHETQRRDQQNLCWDWARHHITTLLTSSSLLKRLESTTNGHTCDKSGRGVLAIDKAVATLPRLKHLSMSTNGPDGVRRRCWIRVASKRKRMPPSPFHATCDDLVVYTHRMSVCTHLKERSSYTYPFKASPTFRI